MELTIIQSSVTLFEILCVIIVFASIFMRSRFFIEIYENHPKWTTQILLMVFFGILSIFGTISGLSVFGAVVNIRDLGPMAAGLVCGPYVGIGAGIIGGVFRFYQGGPYMWTGLSAPILSGILGGIMYLANKRQFVPTWVAVVLIGLSETLISCYTLILVTKPSEFFTVVTMVAIPMIVFNVIGMVIFASVVHLILQEQKDRKERQLLEIEVASKRNLFTIINTISYPVYVLDRDHRFTLVNDSMCLFIGRLRDEMLGKTPRVFFSENDSAFHWEMTEDVFHNKANREDEVTITKPDAQQCTLISTSTLYTDGSGQMFMVGVIQDITERKKAEELVRVLAQMSDDAPASITIHDFEGNFIYANEETFRLHGYTREEYLKKSLHEIDVPESEQLIAERMQQIKEKGVAEFDVQHFRKDGSIIPLHVNGKLVEWGGRKVLMSIATDLTERKKAEEALKQANKKLNLLSSITRHDIRNQISVLLGYIDMLKEKVPEPSLDVFFQTLTTAAKRINVMIQFTKEYEQIGVNASVWQDCRALVDTAAKQATLGKVNVKNDLPAGTKVFGDPLIIKVCYNLIDNAVRYGGKITTIRFSLQEQGDDYVIVCEDDGEGVIAEEKEKIFERGFGKNTGLGLTLSREILGISGITIKETGEHGIGARFEITVPKEMFAC
ncbi:MAG: PAS domain S-box protein [Methanoregula sp.]|nr:PAS domain S-box protein [Methanoregula sp.]